MKSSVSCCSEDLNVDDVTQPITAMKEHQRHTMLAPPLSSPRDARPDQDVLSSVSHASEVSFNKPCNNERDMNVSSSNGIDTHELHDHELDVNDAHDHELDVDDACSNDLDINDNQNIDPLKSSTLASHGKLT